MKWVRCPSCRTLSDVHRYLECDGCSRDLTGVPPAANPALSTPGPAERDSTSSSRVSWIISLLLLFGTVLLPVGVTILTAVVCFVMFLILFVKFGVRQVQLADVGTFLKVAGVLLAVVAGAAGAAILVGIACAVNLQGFRVGG